MRLNTVHFAGNTRNASWFFMLTCFIYSLACSRHSYSMDTPKIKNIVLKYSQDHMKVKVVIFSVLWNFVWIQSKSSNNADDNTTKHVPVSEYFLWNNWLDKNLFCVWFCKLIYTVNLNNTEYKISLSTVHMHIKPNQILLPAWNKCKTRSEI